MSVNDAIAFAKLMKKRKRKEMIASVIVFIIGFIFLILCLALCWIVTCGFIAFINFIFKCTFNYWVVGTAIWGTYSVIFAMFLVVGYLTQTNNKEETK